MSLQVTEGLTVAVLPNLNHEFLMPTKDVAKGYGVTPETVRSHLSRNSEDFIEGKHFLKSVAICNGALKSGSSRTTMFTKRGIVRLGFFIKSQNARLFRDWAEDLIMDKFQSESKSKFNQLNSRLKADYQATEQQEILESVSENAIIACGSATKLAKRLGISSSVFTFIKNRPWLVSQENQKAIIIGCRNILNRNAQIDTETIEQLLKIEDAELRMTIFSKMQKGGLI